MFVIRNNISPNFCHSCESYSFTDNDITSLLVGSVRHFIKLINALITDDLFF